MDPSRLDLINDFFEEEVRRGTFPGAVVLIVRPGLIVKHKSYGLAMEKPTGSVSFLPSPRLTSSLMRASCAGFFLGPGTWGLRRGPIRGDWRASSAGRRRAGPCPTTLGLSRGGRTEVPVPHACPNAPGVAGFFRH